MYVGDILSTVGDIMMHVGDILSTVGDILSTVGDILSTVGDILSTVGDILSTVGISWVPWGLSWGSYHVLAHWGERGGRNEIKDSVKFFIPLEAAEKLLVPLSVCENFIWIPTKSWLGKIIGLAAGDLRGL